MCPRIFKKIVSIITRFCALWNGWPNAHFAVRFFPFWLQFQMMWIQFLNLLFAWTTMKNVWVRQFQALQNTSGIAMLLNLRGGCRAELVDVAKKFSKSVSFCSTWKVALEFVCFRFLLAKASNSARAQNSELSMWHWNWQSWSCDTRLETGLIFFSVKKY